MPFDASRDIEIGAEVNVQSSAKSKNPAQRWSDRASIRLYGESRDATALQIWGVTRTPAALPAYAHARLTDDDLRWLSDTVKRRCEERGIDLSSSAVAPSVELIDVTDLTESMVREYLAWLMAGSYLLGEG